MAVQSNSEDSRKAGFLAGLVDFTAGRTIVRGAL
jgi:hypothetical protein